MNSLKLLGQQFEAVRNDTVIVDMSVFLCVCVCVFFPLFSPSGSERWTSCCEDTSMAR